MSTQGTSQTNNSSIYHSYAELKKTDTISKFKETNSIKAKIGRVLNSIFNPSDAVKPKKLERKIKADIRLSESAMEMLRGYLPKNPEHGKPKNLKTLSELLEIADQTLSFLEEAGKAMDSSKLLKNKVKNELKSRKTIADRGYFFRDPKEIPNKIKECQFFKVECERLIILETYNKINNEINKVGADKGKISGYISEINNAIINLDRLSTIGSRDVQAAQMELRDKLIKLKQDCIEKNAEGTSGMGWLYKDKQ